MTDFVAVLTGRLQQCPKPRGETVVAQQGKKPDRPDHERATCKIGAPQLEERKAIFGTLGKR